jgi:4-hydroxybenzoate polyprenyltransferase
MNGSAVLPSAKGSALRYVACLRPQDILVLQGSPLLGALFASRQPATTTFGPLAILLAANLLLVAHIFLLNDWSGLSTDLADANKAQDVFTVRGVGPREMAVLSIGLLLVSLALFSLLGWTAFALTLSIAALSALYSLPRFNWKGRPLLNTATHLAGGIAHFLLGYSVGRAIDPRGVAIAVFFALVFAAGHLTQEIRDHRGDARNGTRTNAVVFGPRRAFAASLTLFGLAQAVLLALALLGTLPRPLALVVAVFALQLSWSAEAYRGGLTYEGVSRLQTRYRVLYALIGLAMAASAGLGQ